LDDRNLLHQPADALGRRQLGIGERALHAQRPVDGEGVDAQPLEALHQSIAGAPVESDALLDLRGGRRVLEQHDVGLWMARAEDRHQVAARAGAALLQLAGQLVELADRALQVLLADLVVRRRHRFG
jgi:hypothetical protein